MDVRPWKRVRSTERCRTRVFSIREDVFENPRTGNDVPASIIECPDWVNAIVTTPAGDTVLIQQFRFGSNKVELEIPGGTVEPGEDPAAAAAREVLEETGYASEDAPVFLGKVNPNPAIHGHACHTYWITNATPRGAPAFDGPNEACDVVLLPLAGVLAAIADGHINHGLVIDAVLFFLQHAGKIQA